MTQTGKVVGLITARGGSKSIPRKNIIPVGGKPLIAWSIEAALRSQTLERVIVSTDDAEIAEVSRRFGAEVPFLRPAEFAQDASSHISVVTHGIQWLREREGYVFDYLVLLQPTSPLRTEADIDGMVRLAWERGAEAVISVVETHHHPYLVKRLDSGGALQDFMPADIEYLRRQDLPPAYFINGAVYVNRCVSLLGKQTFYPPGMLGYVMPPERSWQVDLPWDMQVADLLLRQRNETGG